MTSPLEFFIADTVNESETRLHKIWNSFVFTVSSNSSYFQISLFLKQQWSDYLLSEDTQNIEFPSLVYRTGSPYSMLVLSIFSACSWCSSSRITNSIYVIVIITISILIHNLCVNISCGFSMINIREFQAASSTWGSVGLHWFTSAENLAQSPYWKWQNLFAGLSLLWKDNAFHRKAVVWYVPLCNSTVSKAERPKTMRTLIHMERFRVLKWANSPQHDVVMLLNKFTRIMRI